MFDIDFFKEAEEIKNKIVSGKIRMEKQKIFDGFEKLRSKKPFVFNIETTNFLYSFYPLNSLLTFNAISFNFLTNSLILILLLAKSFLE